MFRTVRTLPFKATDYIMTVAEVSQATSMLDKLLTNEDRDELINCLAFQPDVGESLDGCQSVRKNVFEFGSNEESKEISVIYFFHDLNMPLYILAVYEGDKELSPNNGEINEMNKLAADIVRTYSEDTQRVRRSMARRG